MIYAFNTAPENVQLIGGKGLSLVRMTKAGFLVPPGFIVPSNVDIKKEGATILEAFDKLGAEYVAVRSSAAAEDGDTAAWAGQLLTKLNITRQELLQAVAQCSRSIDSDRAKSYAQQHNISAGGVAVVVQQMVQSEISGVAFSRHPVTSDASVVIIEAGLGLGEAIVSGEITPDTYIVQRKTYQILEKHISKQLKQFVRVGKKTSYQALGATGTQQKLPDNLIQQLTKQVEKLEMFSGKPVDVEWAVYKGKIYITQSRPITTL